MCFFILYIANRIPFVILIDSSLSVNHVFRDTFNFRERNEFETLKSLFVITIITIIGIVIGFLAK